MSTGWFIHSITHYKPKNEKIKDVHRLVDDLERALVTGSTPILSLTKYLSKKCAELDKKYPRTRPLIVKRFNASITIYSGSPEKAQVESGHTAISFMVSPVKRIVSFNDGEIVNELEGGDEV